MGWPDTRCRPHQGGPAGQPEGGTMRRIRAAAAALLLALIGVMSVATASQAGDSSTGKSRTLVFDVQFSPFTAIATNNVREPNSPFSLGDEILFHDQFLLKGRPAGESIGSCVIVVLSPPALANCTGVFRLTDGNIAVQFVAVQGPEPRAVAVTGGTGALRHVRGGGVPLGFRGRTRQTTAPLLRLPPPGRDAPTPA